MTSVTIVLKGGTSVDVKNLTAINVFNEKRSTALTEEHLETVNLNPNLTYSFIGEKETVSVAGVDVLYLHFSKA